MSFIKRFSWVWLPLFFFAVALFTLYDYGMNWDSPIHFARGQAYLRYMLTGKTNYAGSPQYCMNSQNQSSSVDYVTGEICDRHRKVRVSEYESSLLDFNSWAAKAVYGHPAFSGIMLALSNTIFFKTLGWVEDIPAYHLYSIFTTFILALTVSIWTKQTFGTFASIIAVLTIYTFPLLAGEQHFNVKDPPMATFFTLSIYLFWLAVVKNKPKYLIFSAFTGGASFGTKFNFVFAPFILLPWILTYGKILFNKKSIKTILSKNMVIAIILYPVIVFLVFFLTWPALWSDPLKNVPEVFRYYKDIGGSSCAYTYLTPSWWKQCTNLITLKYIFFTTPPYSLFLFATGLLASIFWIKRNNYVLLLILFFFLITILRVTLSISSIYGGLRQIMEFIGPLAIISGIGALFLRNLIAKLLLRVHLDKKSVTIFLSVLIISGFIPISLVLIKLHPNENIYFNYFIGGFKGAAESNFPGYGNTYGNAYTQGVKWLNLNATKNTKLALVSGLGQNLSRGQIRADIDYSNNYRSGYNQESEYQMLLIEGNDPLTETFRYKYLSFLNPVYTLNVEGIPLLKIWKNSKDQLKDVNFESQIEKNQNIKIIRGRDKEVVIIVLDKKKDLKGLGITFSNTECKKSLVGAKISISSDGIDYLQKAEGINNFSDREIFGYDADFVYLYPGDEAKYIKITPPENYSCSLSDIIFSVHTFTNLYNVNP